jgi:hypothetical protein
VSVVSEGARSAEAAGKESCQKAPSDEERGTPRRRHLMRSAEATRKESCPRRQLDTSRALGALNTGRWSSPPTARRGKEKLEGERRVEQE